MAANEPPYLNVGTDVSAKYKGAFCEAKVKKVNRSVKVKVILKECHSSLVVTDDNVKGHLVVGGCVEVKQPSNGQVVDGVINKLTDSSTYTVVFDDGDEATLRRTQLCLKGDKHFTESETLDNLPLSHPEHFGTPVLQKKTKKAVTSGRNQSESDEETESDDSIPKRQCYKGKQQELVGKVMMFEATERRKGGSLNVPVLIVLPDAHDTELRTKDHMLVKSFKDSKFLSVLKKELKEFTRDIAVKNDIPALKNAMEKSLNYFENRDLPASWKREDLLGSDEDDNDEEESSDDEQNEEKDRFVAQLYKFMDDRGTPINKGPSVGVYDLNLYRLFKIVQNIGGYNKVTNLDKWRLVYNKMGLPSSNSASSQMKNAYKKFLHAFEDFYRKLGSTMGTLSRPGRHRNNSGRNIIPFRGRDKEASNSPRRIKKEEKEIDDSSSDKSKTKSEDASDTDSLLKEETDSETTKRSVTRREKERLKEESKEQKPEREKRESTRGKTEDKKEEEEKRATRREKEDDRNSIKDEKVTPKKEDKSEDKNNRDDGKEDSIKKRITRRKSGRGDEKKEDEEEEEDDRDSKKKGKTEENKVEEEEKDSKKKGKMEEKKIEEKKLTRKDMKDKKMIKEEKATSGKEDQSPIEEKETKDDQNQIPKSEDLEENDEDGDKLDDEDKKKEIPFGTKVKVKYGRGKNLKVYEAKVVECKQEGTQKTYLVHYAGWNNRYDEWIRKERIIHIERPDVGRKSVKKLVSTPTPPPAPALSPRSSLKQQLVSQIQKKRGRTGTSTPPPTKSSEFRIPQTRSPQPTSTPQSKNRPTRSNSLELKASDILPVNKPRKTRRSSNMTDNSDAQSRGSDESSDEDEELDIDEKIPDLSETGSLVKTPERDEPESELETSMEEEAPELEAIKPIEELPSTTPMDVKDAEPERTTTPSPEPVEEPAILEPVLERTPKDRQVKETKDKTPKDVKDKPKEIKITPKESKEKPKDIKEKVKELKELKEKVKELKDKPKDLKEKITKEVKEKVKETKDVRRLLIPDVKPAEVKSTSVYDFEDTEISDDFKIEEKRVKKEASTEFTMDNFEEIVQAVLCPDHSKVDQFEEIKLRLEKEKADNEKRKLELEKRLDQFEEMVKQEIKAESKDLEDSEKKTKTKKKDLKDSAKKDTKDVKREVKRGRPPLEKPFSDLTSTPKADPTTPSSQLLSSLARKVVETPVDESNDVKFRKDATDLKTKSQKKNSVEKTLMVENDKLSDSETKELTDNLEKKKVKKKIKKKIFGENLNDSSEPLAFSDLTKEHLDKLKTDFKKEVKTPKSACKDKVVKPKESKKLKDIDLNKEATPLLTCAIASDIVTETAFDNNKRVRSRSVSPVDKNVKIAKLVEPVKDNETSREIVVPKVIPSCSKNINPSETISNSALLSASSSVSEVESKTSVVTTLLDNTPPRTPEQLKSLSVSVPSASKEHSAKPREDNSVVSPDQMSNSGSESPTHAVNSVTSLEGTESSVIPSSESSNDIDMHNIKRKRESEDPTPTKKQKRRTSNKVNKNAERNKSKFNGSDSEDTNSSKFPSPHHTPGSPHKQFDSPRPPRSPKYNFNIEESQFLYGEQKIVFITDKMKEIRKLYFTMKSEVAAIDKRRKRARRKERDHSQSSHVDNESS